MEVKELEELSFDEKKHLYCLKGEIIPSVTTVMKALSNSVYGEVDKDILNAAATRGTSVHQAIEDYLNFGIKDIPFKYRQYLDAFIRWKKEMNPEVIATEYKMYHKYLKYAGTCDLLAFIAGDLYLIDYKTSSKVEMMLTRVQLEAYKRALETHGIEVKGKAILHLRKDGEYRFVVHDTKDENSWKVFLSLLDVYRYIKTGGN